MKTTNEKYDTFLNELADVPALPQEIEQAVLKSRPKSQFFFVKPAIAAMLILAGSLFMLKTIPSLSDQTAIATQTVQEEGKDLETYFSYLLNDTDETNYEIY